MTSLDVTQVWRFVWRFSPTSWSVIISRKINYRVITTSLCDAKRRYTWRGQSHPGLCLTKTCLVLPTFGCCILLLLVPKMVLTLCNWHWWWCLSCHELARRKHLHLQWPSPATCPGGVFLYKLVHLLMYTHDLPCCHCPRQLDLAMVFRLPTRHLLMCTHAHEHTFCNLHWVVVVVCGSDFMY